MDTLLHAGLKNALSATFLALVVACLGRIFARRPAALHCLWFLVLLKLVTPPLYDVSIPIPAPFAAGGLDARTQIVVAPDSSQFAEFQDVNAGEARTWIGSSIEDEVIETGRNLDVRFPEDDRTLLSAAVADMGGWLRGDWKPAFATIWLTGTLVTLLVSCRRIRRFHHLLEGSQPASEDVQDWVDELSADLGLGRSPTVWWISGKVSPMLWALGRSPRLIIPIDLWKGLDNRQRGTLLVHELAHLRRGDHHVRVFELVVTALYWWNPVLWWVRRALRDVEEQCCDAWVVWAFPDHAKSYAETLLETLDFLHQSDRVEPLLASGFGTVHHLRKRLTMIMNGNTPRSVSVWGALGSLSLAVVLLPLSPSWAQQADEPKEVGVVVKTVGAADEPIEAPAKIKSDVQVIVDEPKEVDFVVRSDAQVIADQPIEETATVKSDAQVIVRDVIGAFPENQVRKDVFRLEIAPTETLTLRATSPKSGPAEDGKSEIHLQLKIEGTDIVIDAGSIPEAVKKVKAQIDTLFSKKPLSEANKQKAELLEKTLKALAGAEKLNGQLGRKTIALKQLQDKLQNDKLALVRKLGSDKKLDAENAARTDKAKTKDFQYFFQVEVKADGSKDTKLSDEKKAAERSAIRKRVESLSQEVREKRVELAAAQKRLSELDREVGDKTFKSVTIGEKPSMAPHYSTHKPGDPVKARFEVQTGSQNGAVIKGQGVTGTTKVPSSDQTRIDALEKTLQKLLDEVASLKKEKSDAKK